MTCDSCGQKMDPFGDDEIDVTDDIRGSGDRKVKAMCSNCGHIQYGRYREFEDIDESDSD